MKAFHSTRLSLLSVHASLLLFRLNGIVLIAIELAVGGRRGGRRRRRRCGVDGHVGIPLGRVRRLSTGAVDRR